MINHPLKPGETVQAKAFAGELCTVANVSPKADRKVGRGNDHIKELYGFRAVGVGSSPGVGRLIDQSGDAAEGSEKKKLPLFSFIIIMMDSRGTFIL